MTRFIVTDTADAGRTDSIDDLAYKAGEFKARKFDGQFEYLYDRIELYSLAVPCALSLGTISAS